MKMTGYQYNASAGETMDAIALTVYGSEQYAADLMGANPEHAGKFRLDGGEAVLLPAIETREGEDIPILPVDAPWKEA